MKYWDSVNEWLAKTGKTKDWLSRQIGIPVRTLVGWFYKDVTPNMVYILKIEDITGMSLDYMCGRCKGVGKDIKEIENLLEKIGDEGYTKDKLYEIRDKYNRISLKKLNN